MDRAYIRMYKFESYSEQKGKCFYCKCPMNRHLSTADHLIPISKGGLHNRKNIKASCRECNETKSNLTDKEFIKLIRNPYKGCNIYLGSLF